MKIQHHSIQKIKPLAKPVNVVKNVCNYTYNILPRSYKTVQTGIQNGAKIAEERNLNKFRTFFKKSKEGAKALSKEFKPLEIPVVLSALALPTTPVGGSPIAFGVGCIIALPVFVKQLVKKELTFKQISEFLHNMSKKDFIKLDEEVN